MAYVGITTGLLRDVRDNISQMMHPEIKAVMPDFPHILVSGNNPYIVRKLWGDNVEWFAKMPTNWMDTVNDMYFCYGDIRYVIRGKPDGFLWPPRQGRYDHELRIDGTDDPELLEAIRIVKAKKEIRAKWNATEQQVMDFLKVAKSLNEALKLWPQLALYIPKTYLEKVEYKNKQTRKESEAAKVLQKIDTETLTAHAVAARMNK